MALDLTHTESYTTLRTMTPSARQALRTIRRCIGQDRVRVARHFVQRLDQRGMVWPDVLTAIERPGDVQDGGHDRHGRPKWIIAGPAADGQPVELVCVIDKAENDTLFVTIYWR